MSGPRTFVDRGGTFTDVVVVDGDVVEAKKVRSDEAVVGQLAVGPLVVGTTVATNALLERRVARCLLLVTEGFEDLPRLRAMARPSLFDPFQTWPEPLVARVVGVRGRLSAAGGELVALEVPPLPLDDVDAVAIALLHSDVDPRHERALAEAVRALRPDLPVSLGHQLQPLPGYLARVDAASLDAAVTPVLQAALRQDQVPPEALAIRSDGGLCPAPDLRAPDAVLSGPAGGVLAALDVAARLGVQTLIGLDMGGTSTDVCAVRRMEPGLVDGERLVAGHVVWQRHVDVETIAAGGGSVVWHDGQRLRVGPHSAGAHPGPQCYGRGGPPTVTDAALAVGLLDPNAFTPPLDACAVRLPDDADAVLDVAREQMAAAVRRICARRGVDPAASPLLAYGGAAAQHAAHVAALVGCPYVVIHPLGAVLSAWGQALASRTAHAAAALWAPLSTAWPELAARLDALDATLPPWPEVRRRVGLRGVGADHALEVDLAPTLDALLDAYAAAHRQAFGVPPIDGPLEVATARVTRTLPGPPPPPLPPVERRARITSAGTCLDGAGTTVLVPPGWTVEPEGPLLLLRPPRAREARAAAWSHAAGLAVWHGRLRQVVVEAGEHLRRLARSVNIRHRLDYSCALFDADGVLVVSAPHVPVHLGAMGETVRDLLRHHPAASGPWLTNAPDAGGSHLPDLTVMTPVQVDGRRFVVACRAHHVDVGGLTPGSMPPHATRLADEGVCVTRAPLVVDGRFELPQALRGGSRQPDVVAADLLAQIACNHEAARRLTALADGETLSTWCAHLLDAGEAALRAVLPRLRGGEARDVIDGVPLLLRAVVEPDGLTLDFSGTGGPHLRNLNAPRAVVVAAVLYALRVIVADDLPLNEGSLRPVRLVLPPGSVLDPPPGRAVAGGNVETSQRVADLVLRALGHQAAGQGTMNNLTLGGDGWSTYETHGGGAGAGPQGPGPGGGQVGMTNTRGTDPEVIERCHPVRVWRQALRPGTGGGGHHRGGDGLVRELEVLAPTTAALLATRRQRGAPGLAGGGDGAPGEDALRLAGRWIPWDGAPTTLSPGDRVRLATPGGGGWGASSSVGGPSARSGSR